MGPPHSMILSALSWSPHGFVFSIPKRPHTEWWFAYILFTTTVFSDVGCYSNIDQAFGICNTTRLLVTNWKICYWGKYDIWNECRENVLKPRMMMSTSPIFLFHISVPTHYKICGVELDGFNGDYYTYPHSTHNFKTCTLTQTGILKLGIPAGNQTQPGFSCTRAKMFHHTKNNFQDGFTIFFIGEVHLPLPGWISRK